MRIINTCLISLFLCTALVVVIGRGPTQDHWGQDGVRSLWAIAAICLGAALLAMAPVAVTAAWRPASIGQAVLGGTLLRLFVTMAAAGIYQFAAHPHLPSFLFWAVVFYILLLAIETGFGLYLTHRLLALPTPGPNQGASA